MTDERNPLSITCPKCRAKPGVPCQRSAKSVGQSHDCRVKGSVEAVIDTAQLRPDLAGDVEAVASATMHVTVTRALGCYGTAYDMPGPRRAYTSQHQPTNEGAWSIGKAHAIAACTPAGDFIDRGLSMIQALHECGFGVFEVEPIDFRGMSPGAEGEATCDRSPLTHQHAERPRQDQEEGNQADG